MSAKEVASMVTSNENQKGILTYIPKIWMNGWLGIVFVSKHIPQPLQPKCVAVSKRISYDVTYLRPEETNIKLQYKVVTTVFYCHNTIKKK